MASSNTSFATILKDSFQSSIPDGGFSILQALKARHPQPNSRHIVVKDSFCPTFPLLPYLRSRQINVQVAEDPLVELVRWNSFGAGSAAGLHEAPGLAFGGAQPTDKGQLGNDFVTGCLKFTYTDTDFLVYKVSWEERCQRISLYDLVFENPTSTVHGEFKTIDEDLNTVGHALISDVYSWAGSLKKQMWVFEGGYWAKNKDLWAAIRDASWDSIVLEESLVEGLRRDTRTFFDNRKIYKDLGVVWKRGILLLGPPGNGKTESIKVLLKESKQVALYVKSFTTQAGPELGVKMIFDHARAHAPCILVIEDLDSLVTPAVRSFFLNELDGLAQNEGILTIATTNHPERIDDAILNRPSRFDVKYNFALPTEQLRATYALKWIHKITGLMTSENDASEKRPIVQFDKSDVELAEVVAKKTDGWSFAFLKELFVSFLLRVAHDNATRAIGQESTSKVSVDDVLVDQISALSTQIMKSSKDDNDNDQHSVPSSVPVFLPRGLSSFRY